MQSSEQMNPDGAPYPELKLTPEEETILRECSKEAIVRRAIPYAIYFGVGGYAGAKFGPLRSARYGAWPAMLSLGLVGFLVGRMSYSRVCLQRALMVPDGTLRKMLPHLVQPEKEGSDSYFPPVDTTEGDNTNYSAKRSSMDLDSYSSMNNFDTVSSDYYQDTEETAQPVPEVYASYDDLRNQNRQEYTKKFFGQPKPQERYIPPARRPHEESPKDVNRQQTKYGDSWDV